MRSGNGSVSDISMNRLDQRHLRSDLARFCYLFRPEQFVLQKMAVVVDFLISDAFLELFLSASRSIRLSSLQSSYQFKLNGKRSRKGPTPFGSLFHVFDAMD